MLVRIVKMQFRQEEVPAFMRLFEESKATIVAFDGCMHLELWQDSHNPTIFFTHSRWQSAEHLDHYRRSAFFKSTWAATKALFSAPPAAWSVALVSLAIK